MTATTIKTNAPDPAYVGDELYVDTESFGGDTVNLCIKHGRTGKRAGIFVATAELAAALGLVTQEECDEWKAKAKRMAGMVVSDEGKAWRDRDEWKARAEEAEAEALEQAKLVRTWADRAEKAEESLARVREELDTAGNSAISRSLWDRLRAALTPAPPFVLPTEAGAVIEYTDHHGTTQRWFRTRSEQRPWVDREGNTWHDAGLEKDIAGDFTVRIGAYE